jgi:hypothetical protein
MSRRVAAALWSASLILGLGSVALAQPLGGQPQPIPPGQPPQPQPQPVDPVAPVEPVAPIEPDPEPVEPPPVTPAPEAPTEPADDVADDDGGADAWFRIDADRLGTQLWAGGTHHLGSIDLATNARVLGSVGEIDAGVRLHLGDVMVMPLLGMVFDFGTQDAVGITAPLIIASYDSPQVSGEAWLRLLFQSPFNDTAEDLLEGRLFALYKLTDAFAIGPQLELTYRMNQDKEATSLPIGGQLSARYGDSNWLTFFLGYDTKETPGPDSDRLAGRITYIHVW